MALIDSIKLFLKITSSDKDAILNDLITTVFSEVEAYCNQPILKRNVYVENLLREKNSIILPYTSKTEVGFVQEKYQFDTTFTTLDPSLYYIYKEGYTSKIYLLNDIKDNYIYRVAAYVGWELEDIPGSILNVIKEMVIFKFKESVVGENIFAKKTNSSSQSNMVTTVTYNDMYAKWYKTLNKYKIYA